MAGRRVLAYVLFILIFKLLSTKQANEMETIPQGQQLNNRHSLVSASNSSKSGFIKPNRLSSSKSHYFGTWSLKDPYRKLVNNTVNDSWGVVNVDINGKFKTVSSGREVIALGCHLQADGSHVIVTLLDSGNLILREVSCNGSTRWVLWQRLKKVGINLDIEAGGDIVDSEIPPCRTGIEVFQKTLGFFDLSVLQVYVYADPNMNRNDCEAMCWFHCGCSLYSQLNGSGCAYWVGKLEFFVTNISGGIFYVLTSNHSSIDSNNSSNGTSGIPPSVSQPDTTHPPGLAGRKDGKGSDIKRWWWIWFLVAFGLPVTMFLHGLLYHLRAKSQAEKGQDDFQKEENASKEKLSSLEMGTLFKPSHEFDKLEGGDKLGDLYSFSYESISAATDNFSPANKLGEGGFGPVFKGILHDGQEIAVKKLSRSSSQGLVEFKNEIMLIAKLQHTNLVRLLGSCVQGEEKMLIYEFMPNNSLDCFLFDPTKRETLNWKKRRAIIEGIAQGLLYLHKYSRFRVIHRDLKASNILLDNEMNPKISDFGMARIFGKTEFVARTNRIVGTYGYMSPEYAMEGLFSEKSDVFSFGVLLIEIISGKKNTTFHTDYLNLVVYAWNLWKEGKILELIDGTMSDSCSRNELQRCIQVSFLCLQEIPTDRPTMSDVVLMLTNETMPLPTPNQPPFCFVKSERDLDLNKHESQNGYLNVVTISTLEAR